MSKLISVVVTAIVSYFAGPVAGAAAGNYAGQMSQLMLNGQYDWGRALKLGLNPLGGNREDFARSIYDPGSHGAPGRIDYKSIGVSAAAAAATAGVSQYANYLGLGTYASLALQTTTSYVANYQFNKWAGYDVSWSNRQLGANLGAAFASQAIFGGGGSDADKPGAPGEAPAIPSPPTGNGFQWRAAALQALKDIGRSVVNSGIQYGAEKAFGVKGASWNWGDVATDAFSSLAASTVLGGIKTAVANRRQKQAGQALIDETLGKLRLFAQLQGINEEQINKALPAGAGQVDDWLTSNYQFEAAPGLGSNGANQFGLDGEWMKTPGINGMSGPQWTLDYSDDPHTGWGTPLSASDLVTFHLNPVAKIKFVAGAIVGLVGNVANDVKSTLELGAWAQDGYRDLMIVRGLEALGMTDNRAYEVAQERLDQKFQLLEGVVANAGELVKKMPGEALDKLQWDVRGMSNGIRNGDYFGSGIATADFLYATVGAIAGGWGAVKSMATAARMATKVAREVGSLLGKLTPRAAEAAKAIPHSVPDPVPGAVADSAADSAAARRAEKPRTVVEPEQPEFAGGKDRLPSFVYRGGRTTLYHYTDEGGLDGILDSKKLWASKGYDNARYGDGQYISDVDPDSIGAVLHRDLTSKDHNQQKKSLESLSSTFYGRGSETAKITHFVEIDITGLSVRQAVVKGTTTVRKGVQFILNEGALSIEGRVVRSGKVGGENWGKND